MKQIFSNSLLPLVIGCMALAIAGCNQEMGTQSAYRPLTPAPEDQFPNGMSAQYPPEGTVARGTLQLDTRFYNGMTKPTPANLYMGAIVPADGTNQVIPSPEQIAQIPYVQQIPIEVNTALLERGKDHYMVFCAVCHDAEGTGRGIVVEKGFTEATTFYSKRLKEAPPGYFFDVISNGLGPMPSYRHQVPPRDRWAIIAHVRQMQKSRPTVENAEETSAAVSPESGE